MTAAGHAHHRRSAPPRTAARWRAAAASPVSPGGSSSWPSAARRKAFLFPLPENEVKRTLRALLAMMAALAFALLGLTAPAQAASLDPSAEDASQTRYT